MKKNQDKSISLTILIITGLAIILWIYNYYLLNDSSLFINNFNINNVFNWAVNNTDLLIIFYIFSSLQFAGISEFKQRQDYLVVALISLIFTPIGLLFIKNEDNKNDN